MTEPSFTDDEAQLMDVIPHDGHAIGNKAVRSMLGWDDSNKYWRTRDSLVSQGLVELGRGRGGSIRRVVESAPDSLAIAIQADGGSEATVLVVDSRYQRELDLYAPLAKVLADDWAKDKQRSPLVVDITASQGRRATGGTWSRPDLVSAKVKTYQYVPGRHLEVITFEVKPSDAIDVQAVYEALAHRRASTHAYVMLHVPDRHETALEPLVESVESVARSHGVGVIVFADPEDYSTWNESVEAVRIEPDLELLDHFIEVQLPAATRKRIAMELR